MAASIDLRAEASRSLSLTSLPPARVRPIQWKRLFEQLRILSDADPQSVLDAAYSVGDALGGTSEERQLRRILATSEGQRLLAEQACLVDALADRDALGALPEGSLGRAFLRFCERHALDPNKLIESQHEMSRDWRSLDPVRQWQRDRSTVMHDLWHVLVGYDATPAGESALMCFSLPQRINDRALPIFIAMAVATGRIRLRNAREAFRRGRRAAYLASKPFEALLPLPLETVREQLRIDPPRSCHRGPLDEGMLLESDS